MVKIIFIFVTVLYLRDCLKIGYSTMTHDRSFGQDIEHLILRILSCTYMNVLTMSAKLAESQVHDHLRGIPMHFDK